jgi:outer membrane biosynthesis protein TonB
MAAKHAPRCTHIKIDGRRCGSPALRGEFFCYFHAHLIKGVRGRVDARLDPAAMFESPEHIQYTLMRIYDQLVTGKLDFRRANALLRTVHIAVINSRRVRFNVPASQIVREMPDYDRQYLAEHPEHCSPKQQTELEALRRQFHLDVKVPTPDPTPSTPEPQPQSDPPTPQPLAASSIKPVIPPQNGRPPDSEVKSNPTAPASQPDSRPKTQTPSSPQPPSPGKASPASSSATPALSPMPATPLTERQANQWEKVKQLHALAERAAHGDTDITTLAASLHRILLDPKSKEKTPA